MPTVGAAIILVFGGLTIYFDNEVFFKMKPTIINLIVWCNPIWWRNYKKTFTKISVRSYIKTPR